MPESAQVEGIEVATPKPPKKAKCRVSGSFQPCQLDKRWLRKLLYGLSIGVSKSTAFLENRLKIPGCEHKVLRLLSRAPGIRQAKFDGVTFRLGEIAQVPVRIYQPNFKIKTKKSKSKKSNSAPGRYSLDTISQHVQPMETKPPLGCIVYLHGGGFCLSSARACHKVTSKLCQATGAIVISVDYRLAPENPFPAGLDDCSSVLRSLLENDAIEGIEEQMLDRNRVIVAGHSSGATMAICSGLDLIRQPARRPLHAIAALCPTLQAVSCSSSVVPSYDKDRCNGSRQSRFSYRVSWSLPRLAGISKATQLLSNSIRNDQIIEKEEYSRLVQQVFRKSVTPPSEYSITSDSLSELATNRRAWPLLAEDEDLTQLPLTFLQTADHDPLRSEATRFADRCLPLVGADKFVYRVVRKGQHCEALATVSSEASKSAYYEFIEFLRTALATSPVIQVANESDEESFRESAVDVYVANALGEPTDVGEVAPRILA